MDRNEVDCGDHFWGVIQDRLCVFCKNYWGEIYACGDWECNYHPSQITFIRKIDRPEGYESYTQYYADDGIE